VSYSIGIPYESEPKINISGESDSGVPYYRYIPTGIIKLESAYRLGYHYIPILVYYLSGDVIPDWATAWDSIMNARMGVDAALRFDWATAYNAIISGRIRIVGDAETPRQFMPYTANAMILMGGTSDITGTAHYLYDGNGFIVLEYDLTWNRFTDLEWNDFKETNWYWFRLEAFSALYTLYIPYDSLVNIQIYGEFPFEIHFNGNIDGLIIIISVNSDLWVLYIETVSAFIKIGGHINIDWMTHWEASGGGNVGMATGAEIQVFYTGYEIFGGIQVKDASISDWIVGVIGEVYIATQIDSTVDWGTSYIPDGFILLETDTISEIWLSYDPVGGMIVLESLTSSDWLIGYDGSCIILISGEFDLIIYYPFEPNILILLGSISSADWGTSYESSGGILIDVVAFINVHYTGYEIFGGILVQVDNITDWGTSLDMEVLILIESVTSVDWGTSYVSDGLIHLTTDMLSELWLTYDGDILILLESQTSADWVVHFFGTTIIYLSGESEFTIHYLYEAFVFILVEGGTRVDWATHWEAIGGIILGFAAEATADWGTHYDPIIVLFISGSSGAYTSATYTVVGGIIIGINANAQADWGTSYETLGIIIIGAQVFWWIHIPFISDGYIIIVVAAAEVILVVGGEFEDYWEAHYGLWRLNKIVASHIKNYRQTMHRESYKRVASTRGRGRSGLS
jgi:hypothetical protein